MKDRNKFEINGAIIIAIIVAGVVIFYFFNEMNQNKARSLISNYKFEEAMEFIDRHKIDNDYGMIDYLYRMGEGNRRIGEYIEKNGYELSKNLDNDEGLENLSIEDLPELKGLEGKEKYETIRTLLDSEKLIVNPEQYIRIIENFKKYNIDYEDLLDYDGHKSDLSNKLNLLELEEEDMERLDLFDKLNLLQLIDDEKTKSYLEKTFKNYEISQENVEKTYLESQISEFFLDEMKAKDISYYADFYRSLPDYKTIVIGQSEGDKLYLYIIDKENKPIFLQELKGELRDELRWESLNYVDGFILPINTTVIEIMEDEKLKLLSLIEINKKVRIIESRIEDDILIGKDKISSKKLGREFKVAHGRVDVKLECGDERKLYKVFRIYDGENRLQNMIVAEYQPAESGELEFINLRMGI